MIKQVSILFLMLLASCATPPERARCDSGHDSDDPTPPLIEVIVDEALNAHCKKKREEAIKRKERNKEVFLLGLKSLEGPKPSFTQ